MIFSELEVPRNYEVEFSGVETHSEASLQREV